MSDIEIKLVETDTVSLSTGIRDKDQLTQKQRDDEINALLMRQLAEDAAHSLVDVKDLKKDKKKRVKKETVEIPESEEERREAALRMKEESVDPLEDRWGRHKWIFTRYCWCHRSAPTECAFHSPKTPGWETCPAKPDHGNVKTAKKLWMIDPRFGKKPEPGEAYPKMNELGMSSPDEGGQKLPEDSKET